MKSRVNVHSIDQAAAVALHYAGYVPAASHNQGRVCALAHYVTSIARILDFWAVNVAVHWGHGCN